MPETVSLDFTQQELQLLLDWFEVWYADHKSEEAERLRDYIYSHTPEGCC